MWGPESHSACGGTRLSKVDGKPDPTSSVKELKPLEEINSRDDKCPISKFYANVFNSTFLWFISSCSFRHVTADTKVFNNRGDRPIIELVYLTSPWSTWGALKLFAGWPGTWQQPLWSVTRSGRQSRNFVSRLDADFAQARRPGKEMSRLFPAP